MVFCNAEYFLYIEINGIICSLKVVAMGAMVVVVEVVAVMEAAVVDMEAGEVDMEAGEVAMAAEVVAMEVVVEVVAMEGEATSMACFREVFDNLKMFSLPTLSRRFENKRK